MIKNADSNNQSAPLFFISLSLFFSLALVPMEMFFYLPIRTN